MAGAVQVIAMHISNAGSMLYRRLVALHCTQISPPGAWLCTQYVPV